MNKTREIERNKLELCCKDTIEKIDACDIRFATGEINKNVYEKAFPQLNKQKLELNTAINNLTSELSNHKDFIEFAIDLSRSIDQAWILGDGRLKSILQNIIFPEGITYDKETLSYRTNKVNSLFKLTSYLSMSYEEEQREQQSRCSLYGDLVVPTRIELVSRV